MKLNRVLIAAAASLSPRYGMFPGGAGAGPDRRRQETSAAAAGQKAQKTPRPSRKGKLPGKRRQREEDAPDYSQTFQLGLPGNRRGGKGPGYLFVCPSVYGGSDDACNMSCLTRTQKKASWAPSTWKKHLRRDSRFFAPTTARSD